MGGREGRRVIRKPLPVRSTSPSLFPETWEVNSVSPGEEREALRGKRNLPKAHI